MGDHELITAPADDLVGLAHAIRQRSTDLREHMVAGFVPMLIVDGLEAIEVDHHQDHAIRATRVVAIRSLRRGEQPGHGLMQRAAIPQARQRVGHADFLEPGVDLLELVVALLQLRIAVGQLVRTVANLVLELPPVRAFAMQRPTMRQPGGVGCQQREQAVEAIGPPGFPGRRIDGDRQAPSARVPGSIRVGGPDSQCVSAGREPRVGHGAACTGGLPFRIEAFELILEAVRRRGFEIEGCELEGDDIVPIAQVQ